MIRFMKTVILAAGFGSRLWPLSTSEKPKQFQPLIGGKSPLSHTYSVLCEAIQKDDIYVLGLKGMEALILEELPTLNPKNIVLVPERRNTLPHTLWALAEITDSADEPVVFKSADQFVLNPKEFNKTFRQGIKDYAAKPAALTLLCTEYKGFNSNDGYCLADDTGLIQSFLEKPTKGTLDAHRKGLHVYRSPLIYIATRNTMSAALDEIPADWVEDAKKILTGGDAPRQNLFLGLPFMDVSSAVFQESKTMRAIVIQYEYIDVGRFEEIYELNDKDAHGNVVLGDVIFGTECRNNLIINRTERPLVVIDRDNTVIVHTADGSLVSSFTHASMIGEIYKSQIHQH